MTCSRRTFLKVAGVLGSGLAGPLTLAGRPPAAVAQDDRLGGTLRISATFGLNTLNPLLHISGAEWVATRWLYSNLTRLTPKRELAPDVAESWTASNGGRVWTFKLRPGVRFHLGRELVADDVVATMQAILDPKTASPYRGEIGPIDTVEATAKHAVRFTLKNAFADFPVMMSVPVARIVAREGLGDLKALAGKEFGSGPFRLREFVAGDHVTVERFATYYRTGRPYLDAVTLKVFPEPTTELTAFKARETDMIWDVSPDLYREVASSAGIDALAVPGGTFANVILPSDKPPFSDNRVREALKYSVDRTAMLTAINAGQGELANDHPISTAYRFHATLAPRVPDVARAKSLLREAGFGSGVSFKLVAASSPPIREKTAVVLKEMARPAGFDIDVEVMAYDRYLAQVWNKGSVPYVGFYATRPTADAICMKLYHPKEGLDEGRWAPSHPEAIQTLEQARDNLDSERRRRLYAQFQKVSRDEGPFLLPFFRNELSSKWSYVRDFTLNASNFEVDLEEVWLTAEAPRKKG
jgi:peptide/nickel transport system substrate-binding protein